MREPVLFLLLLLLMSCSRIDEVDINNFGQSDSESLNGKVAVFGNVTTEIRQHRVTISPVHQWGDGQNVLPEINRVYVLCGNDTIPYVEKEADRKRMAFVSEQPFKGEAGKSYKLVIETPTGDITAEDYLMPLGKTDYFPLIKDHTKLRSYQMNSGKMAHELQFDKHIYTVGEQPVICGLTFRQPEDFPIDSLESVSFVHNDMSLSALFTARLFWYSYHVTEDILDQSETFITCSVSPEFFIFLLDVFNEDDWSLGLFATISGNVRGNVKNGYGYFFASDVQRKPFTYHEILDAITPENE
ncbi:MAG: DUF4249 family protein [Bacteroidales bacterium]|nr:DUF4249 family protein [Bacteroidales bacterium]